MEDNSQTPINPADTGDIIIGSGTSPKPKVSRTLVLGIIIGVIILITGAVAAVVILNQNKSNTSSQSVTKVDGSTIETADNYKDSFLLYANYILTGVASTNPLPDAYNPDADYTIWSVYINRNSEYINIAKSYLDNFQNEYSSDENAVLDTNGTIHDYISTFNTMQNTINDTSDEVSIEEANEYYEEARTAQINTVENIWPVWEVLNG